MTSEGARGAFPGAVPGPEAASRPRRLGRRTTSDPWEETSMKRVNLGFAAVFLGLVATLAFAQDTAPPAVRTEPSVLDGLLGLVLALLVALIALLISLALGMVAVKKAI